MDQVPQIETNFKKNTRIWTEGSLMGPGTRQGLLKTQGSFRRALYVFTMCESDLP